MSNKKVYLVSKGSYSDYHIEAVFDTKELAEKYIGMFEGNNYQERIIEEMTLNPNELYIRKGYFAFFVRMKENGAVLDVHKANHGFGDEMISTSFDVNKNLFGRVLAKDEKHAIKIFNEKRTELIALNRWGLRENKIN